MRLLLKCWIFDYIFLFTFFSLFRLTNFLKGGERLLCLVHPNNGNEMFFGGGGARGWRKEDSRLLLVKRTEMI